MKRNSILSIFISLITVLTSCRNNSENWLFKEAGTLLWVDNSMLDTVIKKAVKETLENSSVIIAQSSWSPSDTSFVNNIKWYHLLAKQGGKAFMLNIDWLENNRSNTRGGWSFENKEIKNKFIKDIKQLVQLYNPNYLTLGVEVNYYALTNPVGYKEFISVFNELKKELKKDNSDMKIGLSFQLELLYGIHTDWKQNKSLESLNAIVENLDYIGISTYPDVLVPKMNNYIYSINYLDTLSNNYKKPIGITETGISSLKYSDIERSKYIKAIYEMGEKIDLKFLIWGSIIDNSMQGNWKDNLGLIYSDGKVKPEFEQWKNLNFKILK